MGCVLVLGAYCCSGDEGPGVVVVLFEYSGEEGSVGAVLCRYFMVV